LVSPVAQGVRKRESGELTAGLTEPVPSALVEGETEPMYSQCDSPSVTVTPSTTRSRHVGQPIAAPAAPPPNPPVKGPAGATKAKAAKPEAAPAAPPPDPAVMAPAAAPKAKPANLIDV